MSWDFEVLGQKTIYWTVFIILLTSGSFACTIVNIVSFAVSTDGAGYQLSDLCLDSTMDASHIYNTSVSLAEHLCHHNPIFVLGNKLRSQWFTSYSVGQFQFPQLDLRREDPPAECQKVLHLYGSAAGITNIHFPSQLCGCFTN